MAVYILDKNGYNIDMHTKGMKDMGVVVQETKSADEKVAMETLFSYLDRGIDDMEAGRMHTVDEAFQIIRERMNNEL